jgi:hypothetical protein
LIAISLPLLIGVAVTDSGQFRLEKLYAHSASTRQRSERLQDLVFPVALGNLEIAKKMSETVQPASHLQSKKLRGSLRTEAEIKTLEMSENVHVWRRGE